MTILSRCVRRTFETTLCCVAFTYGTAAFAAPAWTAESLVKDLNPREYGLEIYLPQADNPMSCPVAGRFRLANEADNYQVLSSIIITAAFQQKRIRVYTASCAGDGISLIRAAIVNMY